MCIVLTAGGNHRNYGGAAAQIAACQSGVVCLAPSTSYCSVSPTCASVNACLRDYECAAVPATDTESLCMQCASRGDAWCVNDPTTNRGYCAYS